MKRSAVQLFITGKDAAMSAITAISRRFCVNVPVNPRFLYSALGGFSPEDAMAFFTSHGVPLKTERGKPRFSGVGQGCGYY